MTINKEIKEENWQLTQENTRLEQLINSCTKELKKCKAQIEPGF